LVLALKSGFYFFDLDSGTTKPVAIPPDQPATPCEQVLVAFGVFDDSSDQNWMGKPQVYPLQSLKSCRRQK
jgi:hypothetical protein